MTEPVNRRPTLKDLAKAAGVSLASASYAVNGNGSLGEHTRTRILRVAAQIGYQQNVSARAMRTGRTGAIGLVLPDLANQFFPTLAQSVIQVARQQGYSVYITDTEGSEIVEGEIIRELVNRGIDGLIWFPIRDKNTAGNAIGATPTIVLDRSLPEFDSIQADYAEGGRLAAAHLIAQGHRRIGIVSGPTDVASMRERCAAAAAHIEQHASLAFHVENSFSVDLEPAVAQAISDGSATAIFAGADTIAIGVLRYANEHRIRVPQQLSVVGFDDIPWAQMCIPALTTVEVSLEQMAAEAVHALTRRIGRQEDRPRRKVVINVRLIERGSVRKPGRG